MPQASEELRAKFPGGDWEAFLVIREHYRVRLGGIIEPRILGYKGTAREYDAIDYLCNEWDYGYDPKEQKA